MVVLPRGKNSQLYTCTRSTSSSGNTKKYLNQTLKHEEESIPSGTSIVWMVNFIILVSCQQLYRDILEAPYG